MPTCCSTRRIVELEIWRLRVGIAETSPLTIGLEIA